MTELSREQINRIVAIVGRDGAIAALRGSTRLTVQDLLRTASSLGLKVTTKDTKGEIAAKLVRYVDRPIDKSVDELKALSKDEIIQYFRQIECDQDELIELLSGIDLKSRARSKEALSEFAAGQLSSLGIFERLVDRRA